MQGPFPIGTHSRMTEATLWEQGRLRRGQWYRVVKEFADADGDRHSVGEQWRFVASMFSPHDDELLIAVQLDDAAEWRILLGWDPERQQSVIESFSDYVAGVAVNR